MAETVTEEEYQRSLIADARNDAFIAKRTRAKKENRPGQQLANEIEQEYRRLEVARDAQATLDTLLEWREFHIGQVGRLRRTCEVLVARHLSDLERVERELVRRGEERRTA